MEDHFDKLIVSLSMLVFLGLTVVFHFCGYSTTFTEQSASLALGCLLGLVKNPQKEQSQTNQSNQSKKE